MQEKDINKNIYRSCENIEMFHVQINGRIDNGDSFIYPCCTMSINNHTIASTSLLDTTEDTVKKFFEIRHNMIEENKKIYYKNISERLYTKYCEGCSKYVIKEWNSIDEKIQYINLSMYPSPCQAKCIYCYVERHENLNDDDVKKSYEKLFNFLSYLKETNVIDENTVWQICPGEITIHPYRNKIYDLVGNNHAFFLTNGFVFDIDIANKLRMNKSTSIYVSLDSGTSETWKKVKGVDNFNSVIENLNKYYEYCDSNIYGQIILKYIIIPGINTTRKDYDGILDIIKRFHIKRFIISREIGNKTSSISEQRTVLMKAIKLASLCKLNNVEFEFADELYTPDDIEYIKQHIK